MQKICRHRIEKTNIDTHDKRVRGASVAKLDLNIFLCMHVSNIFSLKQIRIKKEGNETNKIIAELNFRI